MRSFHYPDLHSTDLSIHRSQISALSAGKATTTVDCEVFLPNSKTSGKTKMAAFSRIKKVGEVGALFKYLKLLHIAELNIFKCLLACGDILGRNPGPHAATMGNVDLFKLPAKGPLNFGQRNVIY